MCYNSNVKTMVFHISEPLLHGFWQLEKVKTGQAQPQTTEDVIHARVQSCLAPHPHLSLLECQSTLQVLAGQHPRLVTAAVTEFLQVEAIRDLGRLRLPFIVVATGILKG